MRGIRVVFHPYNKPLKQYITIKINKKAINEKEYIKYLGVLVDSSLSWKYQISSLTKKISRSIGVMYKLRPFFTNKCNEKCLLWYNKLPYHLCN